MNGETWHGCAERIGRQQQRHTCLVHLEYEFAQQFDVVSEVLVHRRLGPKMLAEHDRQISAVFIRRRVQILLAHFRWQVRDSLILRECGEEIICQINLDLFVDDQ